VATGVYNKKDAHAWRHDAIQAA